MATPLFRGKPYYAIFSTSPAITPVENNSLTIVIGTRYSFAPGNSVIITNTLNSGLRFEGIVSSYNSDTDGQMVISDITNIRTAGGGSWPQSGPFTISLAGERGSKIIGGASPPDNGTGRDGDMYVNTATGEVFIKS